MNARAEFLDFLQEASGTHAFALSALQRARTQVADTPIINPDNPDPMIGWSDGDPNISGNILSRPGWLRSKYLQDTEPGGVCSRYLGWAWVTLVFDRWEDDFRERFAKEMGCPRKQVACDALGDLRHLRHDITHRKGIATKKESGKCILLTDWFTIGQYINVDIMHASRFYDLIANDEKAVYVVEAAQPDLRPFYAKLNLRARLQRWRQSTDRSS